MSKRPPLFRLATGCFKAHGWIHLRLCLVFVCLSMLVSLFTAFTMSVENRRQQIFSNNVSSNYMYGKQDSSALLEECGLMDVDHYTVQRYDLGDIMEKNIGTRVPTVTTNFIVLQLGSVMYYFDQDQTPEMLWLYKGQPFNQTDVQELQTRFGLSDLYIGSLPKAGTNEVLISERLLEEYGLAPKDVMGATLSILLGDKTDLDFHIKVVGVIRKEYYALSGHGDGSWQIAPSVVAAEVNSIPAVNVAVETLHVFNFGSWAPLSVGELQDITSRGELTYCGLGSYQQRAFLDNIRTVVVNVYYVVGAILAAGLLLSVMLMINKFVQVFCRLGGILLSCGLQQRDLYKLLLAQIALIFLLSVPLSVVGTLVGYAVIVDLVALGTGVSMTITAPMLLALSAVAAAAVFVAAMVFYLLALARVRGKTVKSLLA